MRTTHIQRIGFGMITLLFGMILFAGQGMAMDPQKAKVVEHWTQERMNQAIPRDLVIDPRGLGYLQMPDGSFQPHGHNIAAEQGASNRQPQGKPSENADTTPPVISEMNPAEGDTIGYSHTFTAKVVDSDGVKSVSFTIRYPNGATQSFRANQGADDVWIVNLRGFSDGNWGWWVKAKDRGSKGGNTAISGEVSFTVDVGGGGGGGDTSDSDGDTVTNSKWSLLFGGTVQTAAGRIYFQMPNNSKWKGPWQGYVCSGTVVTDTATDRSIVLTAAHCVYDDVNKAFARNVLFIPDQEGTSGSGTDRNCDNDPMGCWVPSFGVVDTDWTTRVFPNNIQWDYAYYVVNNTGAHTSAVGAWSPLDSEAGSLAIQFSPDPALNDGTDGSGTPDFTHALGYSYNQDPNLMYCAEDMTTEGAVNWWLDSCELSGGSSGGPWVQPMDESKGNGPVISVNSWGYTTSPGMAGPKLNDSASTASCLFDTAEITAWGDVSTANGYAGVAQGPCSP